MTDTGETYTIVRHYQARDREKEIVSEGLTLAEAQEHCNDPESSSKTCTTREGIERTEECGPWFDGYRAE